MAKHFFRSDAQKYRDNPLRELCGPTHKTTLWGTKVFKDGSTYSHDIFTGQSRVKRRFGLWGRFF